MPGVGWNSWHVVAAVENRETCNKCSSLDAKTHRSARVIRSIAGVVTVLVMASAIGRARAKDVKTVQFEPQERQM